MITQHILLTVDNLIFTIHDDNLCILLIQRLIPPFKNYRALPGWFVLDKETLEEGAIRELQEETWVDNAYLEQLYTFSDVDRDPRDRIVSCAYMALMRSDEIIANAGSDAKDVGLYSIKNLPELAFDHKKIIDYAVERLQSKIAYTNIIQHLIPKKFTLSDLHQAYEIITDTPIDIRNFQKKILKLWVLRQTGEKIVRGAHRPAMLYEFIHSDFKVVEIL